MTEFERLHPSLQHHIVNSLRWHTLRPLQEAAIASVLDGQNCLVLAPTAGGKTEAAMLPLLSMMLTDGWQGLSVLYVCPLRALLNSLEERLTYYTALVGRRCGLWHGDVTQAAKSKILREPPDVLLTTPESLEALLISNRTDRQHLFGCLRTVVVDEIHAFAGDDRGWHLLAVIDRIQRLAQMDIQRIGLSATVGNPVTLLHWLCGTSHRSGIVVSPPSSAGVDAEITIDYVGDLANAAHVMGVLHRGEKRLVFCDSRARTEQLAFNLRAAGITTYVSHSSLSVEQRRDAEAAFREARDCVIVATSTLELGIDVGDLDRVIQIDAPGTVSSFLQRLGRTGRRPGSKRNCIFLATSRATLLQAAALVELWHGGYLEPLDAPAKPYHLIAQQVLASVLQEGGIGQSTCQDRLQPLLQRAVIPLSTAQRILEHMLKNKILTEDSGILGLGLEGERLYGAKNFLTLVSIFDTPPLFNIFWGAHELGAVHPISFRKNGDAPVVLSLGGRSWHLTHVDWRHATAQVAPSEHVGRSQWLAESRPLRYELCQMVRRLLTEDTVRDCWSNRAKEEIAHAREEMNSVAPHALVVEQDANRGRTTWWTFGGLFANSELALRVSAFAVRCDNYSVVAEGLLTIEHLSLSANQSTDEQRATPLQNGTSIKFSECIPDDLLQEMQRVRSSDPEAVTSIEKETLLIRNARY